MSLPGRRLRRSHDVLATLGIGAVVVLTLLLPGACGSGVDAKPASEDPGRPSLLLVSFDTTRADRLGIYGHAAARTPVLDALARRGWLFERARTTAPITLPAHTTLLSGTTPRAHGVRENAIYRAEEACLLVSEVLSERAWRTGAFVGSFVLAPQFGLDQGFEHYGSPIASPLGSSSTHRRERPAGDVVDEALAWSAGLPGDARFFIWTHFYDPHAPLAAPEPYASELQDPYDAEIAYADAQLGRLLDGLEQQGRARDLWIVFTSDHGESLGEHGEEGHGIFVYDATMHVPLIVVPPAGSPGVGRRLATPVSVTDVAPTLLDIAGLPASTLPDVSAPSLLDVVRASSATLRGSALADRALYMESLLPYHQHRWHPQQAMVWRGHKLIESARPELYDLSADALESTDLSASSPDLLQVMRGRFTRLLEEQASLDWGTEQAISAQDRRALEALGYLGTAGTESVPFGGDLPAPVDRLGDLVLEREARRHLQKAWAILGVDASASNLDALPRADLSAKQAQHAARELQLAREGLLELRSGNTQDPVVVAELGFTEFAAADYVAAAAAFEEHAVLAPRLPTTRYYLALSYAALGHDDWALREMTKAVGIDEQADIAYRWLARHHSARGEHGRAVGWLERLEEVWVVTKTQRVPLRAWLDEEAAAMRAAGQVAVPPPEFLGAELLPEGIAAESRSFKDESSD